MGTHLEIKNKLVPVRTLKAGMVLDQMIMDSTGRAKIEKGAILDDYQIDYMVKNMNTYGGQVYIQDGYIEVEDEPLAPSVQAVFEKEKKEDPPTAKLTGEVKERVNEGIKYLFGNTEDSNFADSAEKVTGDLMSSIVDSDAVALDMSNLKMSDEYTFQHSVDVAAMSLVIGKNMGLSHDELKELGTAGLLHDIGKSKIPNGILNKPGKLTDEEFGFMKQHSLFGLKILTERGGFSEGILKGVLQHHEKISGKGYPQGLDKDHIHKYARIISVADVYDALVTKRPYKNPFSPADAVEMIMAMSLDLDYDAMQSFMNTVIPYPVGSDVQLSTGSICRVVANNPGYPLRPQVIDKKTGKLYDLNPEKPEWRSVTLQMEADQN